MFLRLLLLVFLYFFLFDVVFSILRSLFVFFIISILDVSIETNAKEMDEKYSREVLYCFASALEVFSIQEVAILSLCVCV